MKLTGGDTMSNIINWFQSNRLYALLKQAALENAEKKWNPKGREFKEKQQDYYAGKLTPEEEAEMMAFIEQYTDREIKKDDPPAGAQA